MKKFITKMYTVELNAPAIIGIGVSSLIGTAYLLVSLYEDFKEILQFIV